MFLKHVFYIFGKIIPIIKIKMVKILRKKLHVFINMLEKQFHAKKKHISNHWMKKNDNKYSNILPHH
jgi:hypothetical protein